MAEQPSLTTVFSRLSRFLTVGALISGAGVVLVSCTSGDKLPPPCPEVRVDNATAQLTKFRDGAGRAAGDVEYRVEISGFKGSCKSDDKKVDVSMDADFIVTPGPAAQPGKVPAYYFIAIPQFHPQPVGKQIFELTVDGSDKKLEPRQIHVSDLHIRIPLKKEQTPASFDIYLGLQLTRDQLEYNRANVQPPQ